MAAPGWQVSVASGGRADGFTAVAGRYLGLSLAGFFRREPFGNAEARLTVSEGFATEKTGTRPWPLYPGLVHGSTPVSGLFLPVYPSETVSRASAFPKGIPEEKGRPGKDRKARQIVL